MTPAEKNKEVVRQFVAVINAQDWARLDALVAPDFSRHSVAAGPLHLSSREELKEFLRSEFLTFPDARESIEELFCEGERVAARHRFRGTQMGQMGPYPPSGKVLESDYIAIYRVAEGRIEEAWVEWDNLSGLIQLGHVVPTAA